MLFTVIFYIQEMSASAFLSSQCLISVELKKLSGTYTSGTNDSGIPQTLIFIFESCIHP
jgi:hypothetical protein